MTNWLSHSLNDWLSVLLTVSLTGWWATFLIFISIDHGQTNIIGYSILNGHSDLIDGRLIVDVTLFWRHWLAYLENLCDMLSQRHTHKHRHTHSHTHTHTNTAII